MRQNIVGLCTAEQRLLLSEGFACLRRGEFFAAHERFEDGFRATKPPVRTLFQALAQFAASHHQLTLGRGRAAVRTWQKARAKLESVSLLSDRFRTELEAFHAALGLSADGPRFIEPGRLGPPQSFPMLDADTLQRPSA